MSEEVKIPLPQSLQEIVGALLFASESPLTAVEIRDAVRAVEAEEGENKEVMDVYHTCTSKEIDAAIRGVEKALEVAGCGFRLVCTSGAYRLQTTPSCGRYVRALLKLDRPNRLGRASLETLAIVAYRQPLTKSEIEAIRGVDVTGNIKTLMDLQLIRLVGKSELPGHPFLYGTTPFFLDHFGLSSLQQLNDLDPTLQRSNPRKKAESYRKKVEEKPAEEEKKVEGEGEGVGEDVDEGVGVGEGIAEGQGEGVDGAESEEGLNEEVPSDGPELRNLAGDDDLLADDDEVLIDDTPDEFDDDDEDDEEEEDDETGEGDDGGASRGDDDGV